MSNDLFKSIGEASQKIQQDEVNSEVAENAARADKSGLKSKRTLLLIVIAAILITINLYTYSQNSNQRAAYREGLVEAFIQANDEVLFSLRNAGSLPTELADPVVREIILYQPGNDGNYTLREAFDPRAVVLLGSSAQPLDATSIRKAIQ